MTAPKPPVLTVALPSKGALCDGALQLFAKANLPIQRSSAKGYIGRLKPLPSVRVLLQRATDIPRKLLDGSVHLGVTGLDILAEEYGGQDLKVLIPNLGFGDATLVLAVPIEWVDIKDMHDLATLAYNWRARGRRLRISTKFRNLTEAFLLRHGITHFEIVASEGTTELDPKIGVADLIADLTSTGTALRENQLKPLVGGSIFTSTACMVVRPENVRTQEQARLMRQIVRTLESTMLAEGLYQIHAYCFATARDTLARELGAFPDDDVRFYTQETVGRDGTPLIKYEVLCKARRLSDVVKHLQHNAREVLVNRTDYRFSKDAPAIMLLQRMLEGHLRRPANDDPGEPLA
mgnify:CR=1 FL=1